MSNIAVNTQSSIKITTTKVLRFDPLNITDEPHDADIIFITHDHYDHFSPEDIRKVMKETTFFVIPVTMKEEFLSKLQITEERCLFVEPNMKTEQNGIKIETVPAYNNFKPFHPKVKKWCGYIVTAENISYYIAGDTDDVKENHNIKCDIAFIPIGGTFTMNVKEAVKYAEALNPKKVIPIHYGSIVGNIEDGEEFKNKLQEKNPNIQVELKL